MFSLTRKLQYLLMVAFGMGMIVETRTLDEKAGTQYET